MPAAGVALAASESVHIRLVHHQGRTPVDHARMLERALAGALRG